MSYQTDDLRIIEMKEVSAPSQVHAEFPISEDAARCVTPVSYTHLTLPTIYPV